MGRQQRPHAAAYQGDRRAGGAVRAGTRRGLHGDSLRFTAGLPRQWRHSSAALRPPTFKNWMAPWLSKRVSWKFRTPPRPQGPRRRETQRVRRPDATNPRLCASKFSLDGLRPPVINRSPRPGRHVAPSIANPYRPGLGMPPSRVVPAKLAPRVVLLGNAGRAVGPVHCTGRRQAVCAGHCGRGRGDRHGDEEEFTVCPPPRTIRAPP
jgi:hypothetical protein